jgi:hypothetical protein
MQRAMRVSLGPVDASIRPTNQRRVLSGTSHDVTLSPCPVWRAPPRTQ